MNRNLSLYTAASLDGYIAREDGDVSWLEDERLALEGADFGYAAFYESIDTCLMGQKTYQGILDFDIPFPYADKTNYVFSRSAHTDTEYVHFVEGDIIAFVEQLKSAAGKDIWLVGGGQINALLMDAGLIDEMIITVIPVLLGAGIPLFVHLQQEHPLDLQEVISFENGMLQMVYGKVGER